MKNTYDIIIRLFDFIISLIAILAFLPIFIFVIIILRFTGENEVFYLQKRVGFGMRPFLVIKFATVVHHFVVLCLSLKNMFGTC